MASIDPSQEANESPTVIDLIALTNQRIDDLRADMNQRFTVMVALMIAMIGLLGGIIAPVA